MDRLTVSRKYAKDFLNDLKEGKYTPPISFLFRSKNGYVGVDNRSHKLQYKEFTEKEECIRWLESLYLTKLQESESILPKLREWMTIQNLMDADLIANPTKFHAGVRYNLYKGENVNAKLVKTIYNPTLDTMTFIFKTPATLKAHEPGYQPLIVDPYSNFAKKQNPGHSYTMMIQVLDFLKWLKETRPDNAGDITWQEIKAVLDVAYVKIWCNCSSFHWFGKNYRATQFDASIYPTNIPDRKMRAQFGEYDILCKHLGNLMKPNAIQFFLPQMASSAQKALRLQGLI